MNPKLTNRGRFLQLVKELRKLDADELFKFWSKHQNGRGAHGLGFSGPGSRVYVGDLAAFAANIGAAKTSTGDVSKNYERIAHDILMSATRREHSKRKGNPKMPRKKARTAKQRAATKKMLAANRARLRKKRKTARSKTARRKTPRRKTAKRKARRNPQKARPGLKKSHLWLVFKCAGQSVLYLGIGTGAKGAWKRDKAHGFLFKSKSAAASGARIMAQKRGNAGFHIGVADALKTSAQIRNYCKSLRELTPGKA